MYATYIYRDKLNGELFSKAVKNATAREVTALLKLLLDTATSEIVSVTETETLPENCETIEWSPRTRKIVAEILEDEKNKIVRYYWTEQGNIMNAHVNTMMYLDQLEKYINQGYTVIDDETGKIKTLDDIKRFRRYF